MKPIAPSLSEHLLTEARRFMGYPGLVGRDRVGKAAARLWNDKLLPHGTKSLEWILPKGKSFPPTAVLLNEYYSKQLLQQVPGIVDRAMSLEPIESSGTVPRQVNVYLEQSTRAFVAGLWDGAVALSRACLEATLEDNVGRYIGKQHRDLKDWIVEAERKRILTAPQCDKSRTIQILGNAVLHERSATETEAKQSLTALRQLLSELYR
jgi:hypothetical protein